MVAYPCPACGTVVEVDDPASVELLAATEGVDWMGYIVYSGALGSVDRRELHRCGAPPERIDYPRKNDA